MSRKSKLKRTTTGRARHRQNQGRCLRTSSRKEHRVTGNLCLACPQLFRSSHDEHFHVSKAPQSGCPPLCSLPQRSAFVGPCGVMDDSTDGLRSTNRATPMTAWTSRVPGNRRSANAVKSPHMVSADAVVAANVPGFGEGGGLIADVNVRPSRHDQGGELSVTLLRGLRVA